ncbi:MAG: N-6 DNA methylase [Candidatus Wolfebacteria bacterium]|nr:N-6 DNA methylase [Candidatus Wolfebacteria bacterium]
MDIDIAKERIKILVGKYQAEVESGKIKKYTEEDVKKGFILPLFEILGWNTSDRSEVSSEEHIKSSGRVDYGFYLDNRPKFYLEAKKPTADIYSEEFARQAIRYSWNRGVTWAVLTNFERLIVFNAQDIKSSLANKKLFDIRFSDYIAEFEKLQLLSKESFTENALDIYAEKIGKKFQRVPISSLLYKDLDECRGILTKALAEWNKEKLKGSPDLLDEGVQKLLDRLIFIRVAEDRGVERPTLLPLVREWQASKNKNETPIYQSMVGKFREFDKTYNSNLFSEHPFEKWEEYSNATEKAIKILYGKEGYYEYDFKAMPADVLGAVYENYLGHKLSKSKKGITLDKDAGKRKEQGIYYTPAFIVDYIVRHALQPVLDKCKTMEDLYKIKVLDPACGSGSFLIKALELLNEKYKSFGHKGDEMTKLNILVHNIYGVDLDEQAVEIARLNCS